MGCPFSFFLHWARDGAHWENRNAAAVGVRQLQPRPIGRRHLGEGGGEGGGGEGWGECQMEPPAGLSDLLINSGKRI